jgi:hypothetical protein
MELNKPINTTEELVQYTPKKMAQVDISAWCVVFGGQAYVDFKEAYDSGNEDCNGWRATFSFGGFGAGAVAGSGDIYLDCANSFDELKQKTVSCCLGGAGGGAGGMSIGFFDGHSNLLATASCSGEALGGMTGGGTVKWKKV